VLDYSLALHATSFLLRLGAQEQYSPRSASRRTNKTTELIGDVLTPRRERGATADGVTGFPYLFAEAHASILWHHQLVFLHRVSA
jgi:hypothetical protein